MTDTLRPVELVTAPRRAAQPDVAGAIAQDIDLSFADRTGHACLGYIDGDPLADDMRQEWFYLPTQRDAMIARATTLELLYGDIYIGQCLFQRVETFSPKGRSAYTVARDYAHALPHNEIWKDDCNPANTTATRFIETSPGNFQALIRLDRDCSPAERKRLMTRWRASGGDSCSSDAVHFRRLAGGRNTKPGHDGFRVRTVEGTARTYSADKMLAKCEPERESTHTPGSFSSDEWAGLPAGDALWSSPRWQALVTRQRPQLKTLLIDKQPIALPNKRSGKTNDDSWSNQRAVFIKNALEAYDPPPLAEIRAVAWYFRDYLGERKTDHQYQVDIDRVITIFLDELYTQRGRAYDPKPTKYIPGQQPGVITPRAPRGRAGSHTALVEQVYSLLVEHKAGTQAIIKTKEIAGVIGCHRRTIVTILNELRDTKRIETQSLGQHSGLVVTFLGVIYSDAPQAVSPQPDQPNSELTVPCIESTREESLGVCVLSDREADHSSKPPALADLAKHYNDQAPAAIGERLVSTKTGAITYRRSARHFAQLVTADYPYTVEQAIEAYKADQALRKVIEADMWRRFFDDLRAMSDADLIAYIGGGCRRGVAELARDGSAFDKHLYQARLKCAKRALGWRGLKMPKKATKVAQRAVEDAQQVKLTLQRFQQPRQRLVACEPVHYAQPAPAQPYDAASLIERLRMRKHDQLHA